jgi:hypothetical protein
METINSEEIKYKEAKKKVEQIKGFYTHLLAYVCVNLLITYFNYQDLKPGESYFHFHNFLTAFFWGIGLAAHGLSVFMPNFILGNDWEERKTRELMDKYK